MWRADQESMKGCCSRGRLRESRPSPLFPLSHGQAHQDKDRCRQCPKEQVEESPTPIWSIAEERPYTHEASRERGYSVPHRAARTQDCGEHDIDQNVNGDRMNRSKKVPCDECVY